MKVQELGHVVLYVGDVHKSAAFYHDAWAGFRYSAQPGEPIAAFSGGRTHHELLLIEVGEDALLSHAVGTRAISRRSEDR